MNNNNIEKDIQSIKDIALESTIKKALRARLLRYAKNNPTVAKPIPSPFWYLAFSRRYVYVLGSVAGVFILSFGTALVSANTVPGDLLYPVKVNIVEPVKDTFAITASQKASRESKKVIERIKEAEKLTEEGNFTSEHKEEIEKKIEQHISNFKQENSKVESGGKSKDAFISNKKLEDSIDTHIQKLQSIEKKSSDKKQEKEVRELEINLREKQNALKNQADFKFDSKKDNNKTSGKDTSEKKKDRN
jgi:hypothetical protein